MPSKERKIAASRRKKQTRLTFDPVEPSSPAKSGPSPAKVRFEKPRGSGLASTRAFPSSATVPEDSSDSDDIIFSSSIAAKSQPSPSSTNRNPFTKSARGPERATKSRKKSVIVDVDSSDAETDSGAEELPMLKKHTNSKKQHAPRVDKSPAIVELSSGSDNAASRDEESDSDAVVFTQTPRRRQRPAKTSDEENSEDPLNSTGKRTRPTIKTDDSDDSDLGLSPPKRTRPIIKTEESDESDLCLSPLKRSRPSAESGESDVASSPLKRRRTKKSVTPQRMTRQSKTRRHRTDKEKAVELIKRRRAGEEIEELTESPESESEDSDFEKLSEFEDEEDEEDPVPAPKQRKSPKKISKKSSNENLDEYESDFIESDGELGVPSGALLDIPLEFTQAAHKPLKLHFKDAIEWMIHRKINPAFNRDDQIYRQAFMKLNDEYVGYAKSKFVSSQWTAEFTRAVYARPTMTFRDLAPGEEIEIAGQVICQVCNHRKYVPKYEIQFLGKPYDKYTLDELERESDSDSDDSGSNASDVSEYDANGQQLPAESKTWLSGQYCKANAEQAHSLIHWKWALNDWVVDTLKNEGYLAPVKLAEREKMKPKQRRKYANDIVDTWESQNQIKDLYRDFKTNLETAREATNQGPWRR